MYTRIQDKRAQGAGATIYSLKTQNNWSTTNCTHCSWGWFRFRISAHTGPTLYYLSLCPYSLAFNFSVKANYLGNHPWEEELLQSFLPTVLVSLLAVLIPLILLLIAKKAHTITTLSASWRTITIFLVGFAIKDANRSALHVLSDGFPSAGPFYVGWRRYCQWLWYPSLTFRQSFFTTAMHGAIELALCTSLDPEWIVWFTYISFLSWGEPKFLMILTN